MWQWMNHNSYTNDKRFKSFLELIIKRLVNGSGREITQEARAERSAQGQGEVNSQEDAEKMSGYE